MNTPPSSAASFSSPPVQLPYAIADFDGIGGLIKQRAEDFFVQEIPLYEPSGQGEHIYAEFQKVGLTTFDLIARVAAALNIPQLDIGFAGMKDAAAVTRQTLSIWGVTPEAVMALKIPNVQVLWASRHENKLRIGHLKGNRFAIRIRNVSPTDVIKIKPVLDQLVRQGLPNFFGEQRFGYRNNNDILGAALLSGDNKAVLSEFLGRPQKGVDDAQSAGARAAFDRHDLETSLKLWPRRCGLERRILHRLIRTHRPSAAVFAIDEKIRRLWVSALQSRLFNDVLAQRIGAYHSLLPGDLAYKHDNGACFMVEDVATEQARAQQFEISPTGPLVGYRMTLPTGRPLEIESAAMEKFKLKPENFRVAGKIRSKGARRPLRVPISDLDLSGGVDGHGPHITVAFTLPSGAFATVLIREITRIDQPSAHATAANDDPDQQDDTSPEGTALTAKAATEENTPATKAPTPIPSPQKPSHPLGKRDTNQDD